MSEKMGASPSARPRVIDEMTGLIMVLAVGSILVGVLVFISAVVLLPTRGSASSFAIFFLVVGALGAGMGLFMLKLAFDLRALKLWTYRFLQYYANHSRRDMYFRDRINRDDVRRAFGQDLPSVEPRE